MTPHIHLTGSATADDLLSRDPNALLAGMLLDQQVPLERAFAGPEVIAERMGGSFDVKAIANADPEKFAELCSQTPAIHRYPKMMAGRLQELCQQLIADYDGDAANLFAAATTGNDLRKRLAALPGFGPVKAKIMVALLGKQYGVTPPGWQEAAGEFGQPGYHSVADIVDEESLHRVRAYKQQMKAKAKAAKE